MMRILSGEMNTVRGNKNWIHAREGVLSSAHFGEQLDLLCPIIEAGDSAPQRSTTCLNCLSSMAL